MNDLRDLIANGAYAKKQIYIKDALISWSHRRRFETALRLASGFRPSRLLDYGCGDGTFLALLQQKSPWLEVAIGVERTEKDVARMRQRFGGIDRLRFHTVAEMEESGHNGRYDLITCMEVLEHVVEAGNLIARLHQLLSPRGRLVVSVPVEIGPALLMKQAARRIAGWRGLGDYRHVARYRWSELWASLLPGARQHIPRPTYQDPDGGDFHDHKGFNWRVLRHELEVPFRTERTVHSPVSWFPALASQVWLILEPK